MFAVVGSGLKTDTVVPSRRATWVSEAESHSQPVMLIVAVGGALRIPKRWLPVTAGAGLAIKTLIDIVNSCSMRPGRQFAKADGLRRLASSVPLWRADCRVVHAGQDEPVPNTFFIVFVELGLNRRKLTCRIAPRSRDSRHSPEMAELSRSGERLTAGLRGHAAVSVSLMETVNVPDTRLVKLQPETGQFAAKGDV